MVPLLKVLTRDVGGVHLSCSYDVVVHDPVLQVRDRSLARSEPTLLDHDIGKLWRLVELSLGTWRGSDQPAVCIGDKAKCRRTIGLDLIEQVPAALVPSLKE